MPRSSNISLSLTFLNQFHVHSLLSHIHDTCLVQLTDGDVITRMKFGDKYRW